MSNLSVNLEKEDEGFSLTVNVGSQAIVSGSTYTTMELIGDQLPIMKMVEGKIKEMYPNDHTLLNQQLSHVLPTSIMSELRRIRKR